MKPPVKRTGRDLSDEVAPRSAQRRCRIPRLFRVRLVPFSIRLLRCGGHSDLAPKQTIRVDFMQGVTENREAALALVEKYRDPLVIDNAFDLARTDVALGQLGATESDAQTYCATGRRLDLRQSRSARGLECFAGKPARPKWTLEVWHLRRYPDRPLANQRPSQNPAREATHPGAFLLAAKSAAGGPGHFDREGFGFLPTAL